MYDLFRSLGLLKNIVYNNGKKSNGTAWSDHLYKWNCVKFNEIFNRLFEDKTGYNSLHDCQPKEVEEFISEYYGKPLEVCKIEKCGDRDYILKIDYYDATQPLPEPIKEKVPEKKIFVPKGCKLYEIEGVKILAISEDRAIEKYNKKYKNK